MRAIDLFCGSGGLSLGFENAGVEIVSAFDNWEAALTSYRMNFKHPAISLDLSATDNAIRKLKGYKPQLIIGGPPCQDFSIAGSRKEGARANLTVTFARVVTAVRPRCFVMENVYSIEGSSSLKSSLKLFREAGYGLTSRIIDASLVGVPQMRRRYFLIGALKTEDNAFGEALDSGLGRDRMTVREYFGKRLSLKYYYAHPRNYSRRAIFSVDEPSATIRRVNRPIPPNYRCHPADKAKVFKGLRALTFEERKMIQTFPEEFTFIGSLSQQEHQLANAVPVKLAEYVANAVLAVLKYPQRR